jgi:hypothetical protein
VNLLPRACRAAARARGRISSGPEPSWLAIGLGDMNYARLFREETGIKFPLLVDAVMNNPG